MVEQKDLKTKTKQKNPNQKHTGREESYIYANTFLFNKDLKTAKSEPVTSRQRSDDGRDVSVNAYSVQQGRSVTVHT